MADRVGQQLGNYRLVRLLGRGGFAEVYLGEHIRLKNQVAVKILHTSLEDDDVESFLREAQTVARLKHPHIVRVFDFDVENHTPYLVMDYLPNGNIRRSYPKGSPLPPATIVSYIKQIASAVQYAHDQKLIHRDIKPENMLLDRDNTIVLSDFGIALIAQSSRYQNTQEIVGTAAYMAPEQFQGHPHRASDLYALGVVVYEWLTGDRPFHGSFTEIASQHLFVPPPPLHEKVPLISSEVEQVVLIALEKDSHRRFGSVQAFATALEQAIQLEDPTILNSFSEALKPRPNLSASSASRPKQAQEMFSAPPVDSANQEMGSGNSDNPPTDLKPVTEQPKVKPTTSVGRDNNVKKVWSISKRQIMIMVLGAVLFGSLRYLIIPLLSNQFTTWSVVLFPLLITLLFFGVVFGPWVGLFTGAGGYLLSCLMSNTSIFWSTDLSYALIGFVAGLTLLKTQGHYHNIRTIAFVEIIGAIGVIIGRSFSYVAGIWIFHTLTLENALSLCLHQELPGMILTLILLPFLLIAYSTVCRRIHDDKIWSIGKRQIVTMIIGNVLYGLSILAVVSLSTLRIDVPILGNIMLILFPLVTVLFFGVVFGPWVGLLSGVGSFVIFGIIFHLFVQLDSGLALTGFISGLALLRTKGHYNKFSTIATAAGIGTIGSLVGIIIAFASYISIVNLALISAIASLIVLPVLLIIYIRIVKYVMILPTQTSRPINAATLASQPLEPTTGPQRSLSIRRMALLIGFAVVIIAGSAGILSLRRFNQIAVDNAHAIATATAATAATATIIAENPDVYSSLGILALYDPLRDNGRNDRWDEGTNSGGDGCVFIAGTYHAKEITPNYLHQCIAEATDFSNFTFEVQMTIIKGGSGGIIFRADSATGKWYDLDISQSGQYSLFRFDHFGASAKTLGSGPASAFRTGLNQINLIAVVANSSTFDLYVNHQEIYSVSDDTYSHGEIGVIADNPPAEVVYSDAKVWKL